MPESALSPLPLDDWILGAIETSLSALLTMDEEHGGSPDAPALVTYSSDPEHGGSPENPVLIPAEYSLHTLLDFLSGTTEGKGVRVDWETGEPMSEDEIARDDALGRDQIYLDERPHYSTNDLIGALVREVRSLRETNSRSHGMAEYVGGGESPTCEWVKVGTGDPCTLPNGHELHQWSQGTPSPTEDPYPEHAKMAAISDQSQAIGEFIDNSEYVLARYEDVDGYRQPVLMQVGTPITKILAEHFDIDLIKIESEKRAMLDALRGES